MSEVRAVINQCGVAIEEHGRACGPLTLCLLSVDQLGAYRAQLSESNPDMRHASIGQLAVGLAKEMVGTVATVSPYAWTYNASEDRYYRA